MKNRRDYNAVTAEVYELQFGVDDIFDFVCKNVTHALSSKTQEPKRWW
jgi:hypothetical protein